MKKLLSGLLMLIFVLVPVGTILGCTSTTPTTSTVKLEVPGKSAGQYTYYTSKSPGSVRIIRERTTQFYSGSKLSQPVIKINGVPLSVEYISPVPRTQEPSTVPTTPKIPVPAPQPAPNPQPKPVPAPQPAPNPKPEPTPVTSSMQSEMLGYINAERIKANLAPLVLDEKLCQGAFLKSKDMAVNKYFSHTSPTYGSPFDMMKSLGVTYNLAGENIAKNSSVKGAHDAFMNSSGHRANILNDGFKKVGLGFYQDGYYLFVTQWFTN